MKHDLLALQNMRLDAFIHTVNGNKELRYFLFSLDSLDLFDYPRLEDHIQNYADTIGYVEYNGLRMGTTYRYKIINEQPLWYNLNNVYGNIEDEDREDRRYH